MIQIDVSPAENGTAKVVVGPFYDEDTPANVVTPTSIVWSLSDAHGVIINERHNVVVTPASTVSWRLTADDLAIGSTNNIRIITVFALYDSTLGTGNRLRVQAKFPIEKFAVNS